MKNPTNPPQIDDDKHRGTPHHAIYSLMDFSPASVAVRLGNDNCIVIEDLQVRNGLFYETMF
jgi:hypothetical protein